MVCSNSRRTPAATVKLRLKRATDNAGNTAILTLCESDKPLVLRRVNERAQRNPVGLGFLF
jgi:hypothetical protein